MNVPTFVWTPVLKIVLLPPGTDSPATLQLLLAFCNRMLLTCVRDESNLRPVLRCRACARPRRRAVGHARRAGSDPRAEAVHGPAARPAGDRHERPRGAPPGARAGRGGGAPDAPAPGGLGGLRALGLRAEARGPAARGRSLGGILDGDATARAGAQIRMAGGRAEGGLSARGGLRPAGGDRAAVRGRAVPGAPRPRVARRRADVSERSRPRPHDGCGDAHRLPRRGRRAAGGARPGGRRDAAPAAARNLRVRRPTLVLYCGSTEREAAPPTMRSCASGSASSRLASLPSSG